MNTYHKIQTIFKRDPETKLKTLLLGQYSLPEFEYLKDNNWVFTEKVDGTNIRVIFDGETLAYKGKTDQAQMPPQLLERLKESFDPQIDTFKSLFPTGACLYGEGYGAKIQKGGENYSSVCVFVCSHCFIWLKSLCLIFVIILSPYLVDSSTCGLATIPSAKKSPH